MPSSPEPIASSAPAIPAETNDADAPNSSSRDDTGPLSYADLRRFTTLLFSLALAAIVIRALGHILVLFVVVFFWALVLNPLVSWLEKRGIKRGFAVLLTMLGFVGVLVGVGFLVVPRLVEQGSELVNNAGAISQKLRHSAMVILNRFPQLRMLLPPEIRDSTSFSTISNQVTPWVQERLRGALQNAGPTVGRDVLESVLGLVDKIFIGVVALLSIAFTLGNPQPIVKHGLALVPPRYRHAAGRSFARLEDQMLAWVRATVINGLLVGVSTTILLHFVGLPSVIVFGVLAFFGEFVPTLGPIASSIPALFVAAGQGSRSFFWALAAILFVQQIETHLLVPFIMGRQLALHPLTIVFFALSMGTLFGLTGAILAVPIAALCKILIDEFFFQPNRVPLDVLDAQAETLVKHRKWQP